MALPLSKIAAFLGPEVGSRPPTVTRVVKKKAEATRSEALECQERRIRVVVFSKDRPFQLRCLLRSLREYVVKTEVDVVVVWRADDARVAEAYVAVAEADAEARFERESGPEEFERALKLACRGEKWVLLCVDDALLYRHVELGAMASALRDRESALCVQLKLNPHVCWSHAASRACAPPADVRLATTRCCPGLLTWRFERGRVDWDYGFDLCGALYRGEDLEMILDDAGESTRHPNALEAAGDKVVKGSFWRSKRPESLCPAVPVLSVITVNRVQDVYAAPTYRSEYSLDRLNAMLSDVDADLDASRYRTRRYSTVHIGDVFLTTGDDTFTSEVKIKEVAFLIPARNAANTLRPCLESVFAQRGVRVDVLVIDDASSDDTSDIAASFDRVSVLRLDRHTGVAGALEAGLADLRDADTRANRLVARLDADDACADADRIATQLAYLDAHPDVDVVGGGTLSFVESHLAGDRAEGDRAEGDRASDEDYNKNDALFSYTLRPCHPVLVAWGLHFSCCVAHPTVTYRLHTATYAPSTAEDYDLWLRLTDRKFAVANLSEPLVRLRKHARSVSAQHRAEQRAAADRAAAAAFERRLDTPVLLDVVAALRRPRDAAPGRLPDAARLLLDLERLFLNRLDQVQDADRFRALVAADVDARLAEFTLAAAADPAATAACADFLTRRDPDAFQKLLFGLCASSAGSSS